MFSPWITESSDRAGGSHRPDGAEISRSNAYPGFHPGLFSSPPYGRNCAACSTIPPFRIAAFDSKLERSPWRRRARAFTRTSMRQNQRGLQSLDPAWPSNPMPGPRAAASAGKRRAALRAAPGSSIMGPESALRTDSVCQGPSFSSFCWRTRRSDQPWASWSWRRQRRKAGSSRA